MTVHYDGQLLSQLNKEISDFLQTGADTSKRDKSAIRIKMTLNGLARELGLNGSVHTFGSFSNGFKTGTSDLDVVFVSNKNGNDAQTDDRAVSILQKFAENLPLKDLGFTNITKIFQASVPLLKLTDVDSEMEVDFCVNNELGVRNSLLLNTYCKYDRRVLHLGRLVKEWAKKHELVGTADGCLNSYAYMLLVVFFLQSISPPVVPNLQLIETESFLVPDRKWGGEDYWETKFKMNVEDLPPSQNKMTTGELLINFFQFYTRDFDWRRHAVCMRKQESGSNVDKNSLVLPANDDQWYVEDPFDLKHNLAGKCTRAGKKRILEEMSNAARVLQQTGRFARCLPDTQGSDYYMKCRISQNVQPPDLLEAFEEFDLAKLHFPKPDGSMRMAQAFLQFGDSASRRRAHTKNEKYICDCQLQLHYSSQHSLAEALTQCSFSTYEMASYKMQRQVLQDRERMKGSSGDMEQSAGFNGSMTMKDMEMQQQGMMGFMGFGKMQAPPPPPPPAMNIWEEQKMHPMAKVDPMQQMQMGFWQTQQHRMPNIYPNINPPPLPQTMPQNVAPPKAQQVRKNPEPKDIEKKETRPAKQAVAAPPKPKVSSVPLEVQKPPANRSTGGWLEAKVENKLQGELPPEMNSKLKSLYQHYSRQFQSLEKKNLDIQNEVCLQVPVTNGITASNGESTLLAPPLQEMIQNLKERFDQLQPFAVS